MDLGYSGFGSFRVNADLGLGCFSLGFKSRLGFFISKFGFFQLEFWVSSGPRVSTCLSLGFCGFKFEFSRSREAETFKQNFYFLYLYSFYAYILFPSIKLDIIYCSNNFENL